MTEPSLPELEAERDRLCALLAAADEVEKVRREVARPAAGLDASSAPEDEKRGALIALAQDKAAGPTPDCDEI